MTDAVTPVFLALIEIRDAHSDPEFQTHMLKALTDKAGNIKLALNEVFALTMIRQPESPEAKSAYVNAIIALGRADVGNAEKILKNTDSLISSIIKQGQTAEDQGLDPKVESFAGGVLIAAGSILCKFPQLVSDDVANLHKKKDGTVRYGISKDDAEAYTRSYRHALIENIACMGNTMTTAPVAPRPAR